MNNEVAMRDKDILVMKLLHFFIVDQGYNPIILKGVSDEIWLENMDGPYRIIRINTGYIHNNDQLDYDIFKTKRIIGKIKARTLTFKMNALSLFLDLGETVELSNNPNIICLNVKSDEDVESSNDILSVFPDIKDKLKFNETGIELFNKITQDINEKNKKDAKEAEEIFKEKTPYATYALIAINVIVFILMYILGNGSENNETLLKFGALNKDYVIIYNQYYRIITSAFLHIGVLHLVVNMYSLYILGKEIEDYYGKVKFLLIYLSSAIFGSLLSLIFLEPNYISAGASGAIFGLAGSLLYFGYHYRALLNNAITKQVLPIVLLNLLIGFMASGINNFAHIGGLLGGFITSIALGVKYKSSKFEKINGFIVMILLILFMLYMIFK